MPAFLGRSKRMTADVVIREMMWLQEQGCQRPDPRATHRLVPGKVSTDHITSETRRRNVSFLAERAMRGLRVLIALQELSTPA